MVKLKDILIERMLREKQILFHDGANYNQAVFLAGGAGSGKGFASKKFMQGEKFRRFDVDRWKEDFLELADETDKYPELEDLDLQNPSDVSRLHHFVKDKGIHNRFVNNVLRNNEQGRLPNVLFDVTLKEVDKLNSFLPLLKNSGYPEQNIHLVWVLTDYQIAVKRNRDRPRIVPEDILLQTHEGAADTVTRLVDRGLPQGMDGAVHAILNNPEHTVVYTDEEGEAIESRGSFSQTFPNAEPKNVETKVTIEDFNYITLKQAGKPFRSALDIKETLAQWIRRNAPKTVQTWTNLSATER